MPLALIYCSVRKLIDLLIESSLLVFKIYFLCFVLFEEIGELFPGGLALESQQWKMWDGFGKTLIRMMAMSQRSMHETVVLFGNNMLELHFLLLSFADVAHRKQML